MESSGSSSSEKRACWIHDKTFADRLSSQEHSETHHWSGNESQLDGPAQATENQGRLDHRSMSLITYRTCDDSMFDQFGLDLLDVVIITLVGSDAKANLSWLCRVIDFEPIGMECGGPCPSIDLGEDRLRAEIRKLDPFTPSQPRTMGMSTGSF